MSLIKENLRQIKGVLHFYYRLTRNALSIYRMERIARKQKTYKLRKPEVVNLNANDICNSKCAMCNIWMQKQSLEVSPEQLQTILSHELFQEVKHIGITGGEPTLREDLPQLYEAAIKAIPGLRGLSIITNAIKEKEVIERIEKVNEVCRRNGNGFSMMVSLDGYGETHDKVRGRPGNFRTAVNVINHFSRKNVPVAIGCTISKVNVWEIDELLDFMKQNKIYGRFRVAEFIKRLYNDDRTDVIRNFDEDETYHLVLFFYKLILTFERDNTYQRTYKSIINVLSGGDRLTSCPYQTSGIVLNSRGELSYCAPKSKIIGNTLEDDAMNLYTSNLDERRRVINEECNKCIHDYHAPITPREKKAELTEFIWRNYISLNRRFKAPLYKFIKSQSGDKKQIFITGWYGTETVGDKAILGGIIEELIASYGSEISIVISSIYPLITLRTVKELKIDATVIPVYDKAFIAYAKGSDIIIMGGGPLMDLDELAIPLLAFKLGKKYKKKTIIYGCGLGPLTTNKSIRAVRQILALADEIKLRDQKSVELARKWINNHSHIQLIDDPSKTYLNRFIHADRSQAQARVLRCFLREWTYEYSRDLSLQAFMHLKKEFEKSLAVFIKKKALELKVDEIVFEHMHNFVVGNDDRDFSRLFIRDHFSGFTEIPFSYNKRISTVESIVSAMQHSVHNICMRFHSVVFAHTLGTSFTAIDYTKGGKILNYLKDHASLNKLITIDELLEGNKKDLMEIPKAI